MNHLLDEQYFEWLYRQIDDRDIPPGIRTFWKLARQMYTKEFVWLVPNDDNRIQDGQYLRVEFAEDLGLDDIDPLWMEEGCSMLELLIGVSRRLAFLEEGVAADWFWILIDNLGLRYPDRRTYPQTLIEEVLDTVIWRLYEPDGFGGLFPLHHAERDQRDVEIWYQMQSYLLERH